MKTTARTNIHVSAEARAILSALGAASTGKPSMAGGLAELISRVTDGIRAVQARNGQWRAAWTSAEGEPAETDYAYPSRAEAIAEAVLLRFEEARALALADKEGAAVLAEQEQGYNAMIGESLRSRP